MLVVVVVFYSPKKKPEGRYTYIYIYIELWCMNIGLIFRYTTHSSKLHRQDQIVVHIFRVYIHIQACCTSFLSIKYWRDKTGLFAHINALNTPRDVYIRPYYVIVVVASTSFSLLLSTSINVHCNHYGLCGRMVAIASRLCYLSNRTYKI